MSDTAQHGPICTLQRLNDAHLPRLEAELAELAATRPITLVLPCHARDLDQPALAHIIGELHGATFLSEIILTMNGLAPGDMERAREKFALLPMPVRLLDNPQSGGKGHNVRAAFSALGNAHIVATQDCDVASFQRGSLTRLCYACAHPALGFDFAKMYYGRVTDRLYGRVSRLFFAPLLRAVVRVAGHLPLLDFLLSFRYPLAGEMVLTRELATALPLAPGWGLELSMLCEIFRRIEPERVCQVDGGSGYDHKHQDVAGGLAAMCGELARTLFAQLAQEGITPAASFRAAVAAAYRREAALALRRSAALAQINGLPFDAATESATVETFARMTTAE